MIEQLITYLGIISSLLPAITQSEVKSLEIFMQNLVYGLPDIVTSSMSPQIFMQLSQQTFQILS